MRFDILFKINILSILNYTVAAVLLKLSFPLFSSKMIFFQQRAAIAEQNIL